MLSVIPISMIVTWIVVYQTQSAKWGISADWAALVIPKGNFFVVSYFYLFYFFVCLFVFDNRNMIYYCNWIFDLV
jgi:hypothetical protein